MLDNGTNKKIKTYVQNGAAFLQCCAENNEKLLYFDEDCSAVFEALEKLQKHFKCQTDLDIIFL